MRDQMARIRIWLVVGTSLLVLAVAGFLGYARYRSRAFLAGLPGRLGAEITRETNGYTYSQTVQGRTVFTLHAAKMEQRKDGVVRLHEVGVVLYGRKQDRADRIYGSEFEYDQAKGIVRALGVVHMDLQAPAPAEPGGKKQRPMKVMGGDAGGDPAVRDPRVIHVLTSGLVYLTNLGVAATGEDVEFSEGGLTGRAHGAEYSSDTGLVVLQSAVRVNGLAGGGPMVLTANRAELDQVAQTATFAGARVVTPGETVEANGAVVHVRKDGSPERLEGSGSVRISRGAGGVVTADKADVTLNLESKPVDARLWGGVRFVDEEAARRTQGQAAEARVRFDGAGQPQHVTASGNAAVEEREGAASSRVLTARMMEVAIGPGAVKGRSEVREAEATGGARLLVVDAAAGGQTTTEMAGDVLRSRLTGGRRITNVVGTGHTVLHRVSADGVDETSASDTTELVFRTAAAGAAKTPGNGMEELASAVQAGHVAMVRKTMRKQAGAVAPVEERSTGDRAVYDGDADRVTLTGGVVLTNAESTLWAAKVVVEPGSGDAAAEGGVRVTYAQAADNGKEQEPVHVLASRADLRGDGKGGKAHRALFYGSAGRLARMWQGTSQVEAPIIELEEGTRQMTARGTGEGMQVHAVMLANGDGRGLGANGLGAVSGTGRKRESGPSVVRIVSREMVYADGLREVVFRGGVRVDDADGTMRADQATAYLQGAKAGAGAPASSAVKAAGVRPDLFAGGNVERIIAEGKVEIDQPGRHGVGEKLVYTASDGMFVLTGTPGSAPRVEDEAKGTVTGAAMRFHAGDDRVVVTSEGIQSGGTGVRRRTETRVKQ